MNHLEYAFTFVQDDEEVDRAIAHALIAIAEQLEKKNDMELLSSREFYIKWEDK